MAQDIADLTILGAGIVGIFTALEALERGLSVTLIDRADPGRQASFGNAGVVSPWSCVPQCMPGVWRGVPRWLLDPRGPVKLRWRDLPAILPWTWRFFRNATPARVGRIADAMDMLMQDNTARYRRWLDGTQAAHLFVDSWYVNVFRGPARPDLQDLAWRLRQERGAPLEVVGRERLGEIEPALSPDCHSAVLIKDQARIRDPGALCAALVRRALAGGARLMRADVNALLPRPDGTIALATDGGMIKARKLVLAAGAWSAKLLTPLGFRIPLMAERGYHLQFAAPGVTVNNSVQDMDAKIVLSSMAGGLRVAGTAEFARLDAPPDYARARALEPLARRLLPALDTARRSEWMGTRPSLPDNLPAIGPLPGLPGLLAAFGHSHYGMGMAPATARLIADMAAGIPANRDLSMLRPDRFAQ